MPVVPNSEQVNPPKEKNAFFKRSKCQDVISFECQLSDILLFLYQVLKLQIFFLKVPTVLGVTDFVTE